MSDNAKDKAWEVYNDSVIGHSVRNAFDAGYAAAIESYKREHMAHSVTLERLDSARDVIKSLGGRA